MIHLLRVRLKLSITHKALDSVALTDMVGKRTVALKAGTTMPAPVGCH